MDQDECPRSPLLFFIILERKWSIWALSSTENLLFSLWLQNKLAWEVESSRLLIKLSNGVLLKQDLNKWGNLSLRDTYTSLVYRINLILLSLCLQVGYVRVGLVEMPSHPWFIYSVSAVSSCKEIKWDKAKAQRVSPMRWLLTEYVSIHDFKHIFQNYIHLF